MVFKSLPSHQINLPELPGVISRFAWRGGVVVACLVSTIFFAIGYQREAARLDLMLEVGAHSVAKQSDGHPGKAGTGRPASPRDVLAAMGWLDETVNFRIITADKQLLAEKQHDLRPPLLTRVAPLDLGAAGSVLLEVESSLATLLLYSMAMFLPGLLLGGITFMALKDLPMRSLRVALQEVVVRKEAEERLAKSLSIFSATLESTVDGIFVTDTSGQEVVTNQRFLKMWGLQGERGLSTSSSETMIAVAQQLRDPTAFYLTLKELINDPDRHHDSILELRDGRRFEWNSQPQFVDGKVVGRVSSFRDISERWLAEALLAIEKETLEMVVCGSSLKTSLGALVRHVEAFSGEIFCAILFRDDTEARDLSCATGRSLPGSVAEDIVHHGQKVLNDVFAAITESGEALAHGDSNELIENLASNPIWAGYCELTARYGIHACFAVAVRASSGNPLALIVVHYRNPAVLSPRDLDLMLVASHLTRIVIERHQAEDRLQLMAHSDALTHLPNRLAFHDRLKQALARAERNRGLIALLFLDLDQFKAVNDTLGHSAGDLLLREVSSRLRQCVREVDTVARLGGDEFTLILEQISTPENAVTVAAKIIEALTAPFLLGGQEARVSPSIGIAIYPLDGDNADRLIKHADSAMYRAKEAGGNGYRFFSADG
ncbi:diguanylate cyclase [Uliginosibacterium sp. 31-16]|uniref:diguanylate cyclase domain-containing protein n=1 Tax=Uliginosibacterium sp. 31-16 TaxID=3068315 RepID=UPI00273DAE37|nr:diguanylate cyclase [Uliginosibacterium sp. 31-16]MDP5238049.1 diguanylate cyclase [Uliginosibacterium sp. 31-16]